MKVDSEAWGVVCHFDASAVKLDNSCNEAETKTIARILGVPICTVMLRLSRGRERLRQYINRHFRGINPVSASRNAQNTDLSHADLRRRGYSDRFSKRSDPHRKGSRVGRAEKLVCLTFAALAIAECGRSRRCGNHPRRDAAPSRGGTQNIPEVGCVPVSSRRRQTLDKCVQFQPPNACKVVDGTISPRGSCRIFSPIRQAVTRWSAIPSTA